MEQGLPGASRRRRSGWVDRRRHHRSKPPARRWRKRGIGKNAIGRSRGGLSTKIHALVDTLGLPLHVELTAGQAHEATVAGTLIEHAQGAMFLADAAYGPSPRCPLLVGPRVLHRSPEIGGAPWRSSWPPPASGEEPGIERALEGGGLATRYDKSTSSFAGFIHLACACMWLS